MSDDVALEAARIRELMWKRRIYLLAVASPFLACGLLPLGMARWLPGASKLLVIVIGVIWFAVIGATRLALLAAQCPGCRRPFARPQSPYPTVCQECGFPIP
jgi:hypothetical protein